MFIAHLPSGFLLGALAARSTRWPRYGWHAVLIGSVFPDLDMFYFYLIDGRQTLHHEYWTHLPFFWLCVACVIGWWSLGRLFLASVFVHLVLDSVTGGILWLWPWSDASHSLITVPPTPHGWIYSFVFHWSFWAELAIVLVAAIVLHMRRREAQRDR